MAAVVQKRLDTCTQSREAVISQSSDVQEIKDSGKSYFPQLGVVIGNNSICLRGFYVFS